MRKKGIGKRILSALLTFAMVVTSFPAGQLVSFAADTETTTRTAENVALVQEYVEALSNANMEASKTSNPDLTWDYAKADTIWQYYNGAMLDMYMALDAEKYFQFVKNFYDNGNKAEAGSLKSIPMGWALFDLMDVNTQGTTSAPTAEPTVTPTVAPTATATAKPTQSPEEIEELKTTPFMIKDSDYTGEDDLVNDLYDQTLNSSTLGLDEIPGAIVKRVYDVENATGTYTDKFYNGVVMTEFNGDLYCQWQSSAQNEDSDDTKVVYSVSKDNGATWSETPMALPTITGGFCSSGGWHKYDSDGNGTDDTLVAYINYWPTDMAPKGGYTYYTLSTDGLKWSEPARVKMKDGSDLNGIFEQDPHVLENGRIVNAAHFQTGLFINPIYTDDPKGLTGWVKAGYKNLETDDSAVKSREMEPSLFVNENGNLVMIFRDQVTNYRVLAAVSTDNGENWSEAVLTNMPDARQKQSAGNLPDGTAYIVNCPIYQNNYQDTTTANNEWKVGRLPLTITLSADGKTFTKAYVIGSGADCPETIQHTGTAKRRGYHYPKSVVIGDYLYVSYAKNKEYVEYVRIPLASISLNTATPTAAPTATPTAAPTATPEPTELAAGTYTHSFTARENTSDYFNITGALSDDHGTATYNGTTYTKCLKMGSSANITFVTTDTTKVTLVFNADGVGRQIKVDGIVYTVSEENNYIIEVSLSAGTHTIVRNNSEPYLFYMEVVVGENAEPSENPTPTEDAYAGKLVDLPTTNDSSVATVNGTVITFKDPSTYNGVLEVSNPFVNATDLTGASVSLWVKAAETYTPSSNSWSAGTPIITFEDATTGGTGEVIQFGLNGNKQYFSGDTQIFSAGSAKTIGTEEYKLESGKEYFLTIVFGANAIYYYINGKLVTYEWEDNAFEKDVISALTSSNMKMYIGGGKPYGTGYYNWFYNNHSLPSGTEVRDVKYYNTALTAEQVAALASTATVSTALYSFNNVEPNAEATFASDTTAVTNSEYDLYEDTIRYIYTKLEELGYYNTETWKETGDDYVTLEDVYMTTQFLLECAKAIEDGTLELTSSKYGNLNSSTEDSVMAELFYTPIITRLNWINSKMYNPTEGLFYHAYNTNTNKANEYFWNRGIGSYAMALVSALDMLPASFSAERAELIEILEKLFDGMLKYQDDATGMWRNIVNAEASDSNKLETSGSAMMAYALMKAYLSQYVTDVKYGQAGLDAFNGVVDYCEANGVATLADEVTSAFSLINVYPEITGEYETDATYNSVDYETNDAKGIAPLMLAATLAEEAAATLDEEIQVDTSSLVWKSVEVPNTENKYCIATYMDPANKNGYVITRSGIPDNGGSLSKFPLSLTENHDDLTATTTEVSGFYNGNPYYSGFFLNATIADEQLWLIDDSGHIYSKCSGVTKYYLNADIENKKPVLGTNDEAPTKWVSQGYTPDSTQTSRTELYTASGSDAYHLYYGGSKKDKEILSSFTLGTSSQIMLWTLETSPKYYALAGTTAHTVVSGPNAITESEILKKAQILEKATADATNTTEVEWSDPNVSYTWDTPLDPTTPGKYTMSVSCYGTEIGEISVIITGEKWVDVSSTYTLATEMKEGQKYFIGSYYKDISGDNTNGATLLTRVDGTSVSSTLSGYVGKKSLNTLGGIIKAEFSEVDANDLWQRDSNGRIYNCTDGSTKYYLKRNGDSVSLTTIESEGTIWNITSYRETNYTDNNVLFVADGTEYYLYGNTVTNRDDFGRSTLWTRSGEVYASLTGTKAYSVNVGTEDEFEKMAKAGATVYVQELSEDGTFTSRPVDWTDPNVTCLWESNANVHTMHVLYDGEEIGTITVTTKKTEDDLNWVDLTKYDNKYNRVQSMTEGSPWWYVITEVDNNINSSSDTTVTSMNSSYFSNTKDWYTGPHSIDVREEGNSTYALTGVIDNNKWYFNSAKQLSTTVIANDASDIKATSFLTNFNDSSNRVKPSRFARQGATWLFTPDGADNTKIYTETTDADGATIKNYLTYVSSDNFKLDTPEATVTIYQKVAQETTKFAIDGQTSYTVTNGATYMSEAYLKTKTNLYLREEDVDGNVKISEISWNDTNLVETSWDNSLDTDKDGTYTMTVKYGADKDTVGTITVNVKSIASNVYPSYDGWYFETALGREPDFSSAKLTVTYTDGSTEVITIANGLEITKYDITKPGKQTAEVWYNGKKYYETTVYVDSSPFYNVPAAVDYPEYPEAGATRIDKTATNDEFSWYQTGVTKVELDVAGISVKSGVDVVLVTDVSNSMGRPYDELVDGETRYGEKLDEAMTAASELATILMSGNKTGEDVPPEEKATNNTMTFVTFGGYDADNYEEQNGKKGGRDIDGEWVEYIDATQTVFSYVDDLDAVVNGSFENTKFLSHGTRAQVQIYNEKGEPVAQGENSGGTNYDYAFAEATNAVKEVKKKYAEANNGADYDKSGRQIILMFMTDGAPTYYNNVRVEGESRDYIWGSKVKYQFDNTLYEEGLENAPTNWLAHASQSNAYAEELEAIVDEFYSVGFKLTEDSDNKNSYHCSTWKTEDFETVLANLAGVDSLGQPKVKDVLLAENADELTAAYVDIANQLKHSGTYATVHDQVAKDYQLEMGTAIQYTNGETLYLDEAKTQTVAPVIEVKTYNLYTSEDVDGVNVTKEMVGQRKGEPTTIETVSFKYVTDPNTRETTLGAFSDLDEATNILTTNGTLTTIEAENFTYTNNNGYEYFDWYIGDIENVEYALSYYAYLEGTNETRGGAWREDGVYDTNIIAHLDYIDIDGNHAYKEFPIPQRPWGQALTTIEYYLVNENGEPVNHAKEPVPFANRIRVDLENENTRVREVPWGTSLTINGAAYLPVGYKMYNPSAKYTVDVNTENMGTLIINNGETSDPTTVWVNKGNPTIGEDNTETYNVAATRVAFGVLMTDTLTVKSPFNPDRIVMDYGKAIQVDVLANDTLKGTGDEAANKYSAEVVGFRQYSTDESFIEYVQSDKGSDTYNGDYGTFSIVTNAQGEKVVNYQLRKMLSAVEKVFVIVEVTQKSTIDGVEVTDTFYLCQELDVIPATSVYYETDFVDGEGVFTTTQSEDGSAWSEKKDSDTDVGASRTESENDSVQNEGPIAVTPEPLIYGYDSTYTDDNMLSDGTSLYVEGKGVSKTTSTFTFIGTGFDIISRTGAQDGMIRVQIYKAGTTEKVKTISVLNKSESEWGELYQIPVVSCEGLAYGSYDVKIGVMDAAEGAVIAMNRGNKFYFDAVRIYNPAGVYDTTTQTDKTNAEALEAYVSDKEAYPDITEVRTILLDSGKFDATSENQTGAVFVERYHDGSTHYYDLAGYDAIGPNNEVYLAGGQAIAFKLEGIDVSKVGSIDIAAKSVDGSNVSLEAKIANVSDTKICSTITPEIKSSTSQYYDLMAGTEGKTLSEVLGDSGSAYVFITNTGEAETDNPQVPVTSVLSITDLKVAYTANPYEGTAETSDTYQVVTGASVLAFARTYTVKEPDYDVKSATFGATKCKVFSNATMVVETTQDVVELKVTNSKGIEISPKTTYVDLTGGMRAWSITIPMLALGEYTYTVTGYGADGTSGESANASITVTVKEGGGWQDAKSILQTLFNCRILSIKRGSGSRM